MTGKHIEIFLVDGKSGGITTADVSGWTGHILSGPRTMLKELRARWDAQTNGVYLLLGEDPEAIESTRCYIGKTENFAERFVDHDRKKDWWTRAVVISSREDAFNQGHWGYLESRMLEIAAEAKRCSLTDNVQTPKPRKLSEAQVSDTDAFLTQVRSVLPVLGVNVLSNVRTERSGVASLSDFDSPTFRLFSQGRGVDARARVSGSEFIMLEGSIIVGSWGGPGQNNEGHSQSTRRLYASYRAQHEKLIDDGSIVVKGPTGTLTRDIPFSSPSTAGAIALGRSCNGRASWTWEGGTYADWENGDLPPSNAEVEEGQGEASRIAVVGP
ncbi:GIY-YIG nuclease family protein [Actinomyces qiguomingii]|uniref:GIY-YIG nuclease family protein n=1 Tax=Actinomyces qiguomingii TaxID=2057800 RepID=UPI000CA02A60|nr:GIY-YIG nuclease family protein [Actinomyces qiguomingii]